MDDRDTVRVATLQAFALVECGWTRENAASIARNMFKLTIAERFEVLSHLCGPLN